MKIIYASDIVGKPSSELVPNNIIDKVSYYEDKISIDFSIMEYLDLYYSNKISSSSPFADYDGEIVSTSYGDVAFFNIITPKNTTYYKVVYQSEPFTSLIDTEDSTKTGGEFKSTSSYDYLKSYIINKMSSYFKYEIA